MLFAAATQHRRFTGGRHRPTEHGSQEAGDARSESLAEIAVDERVDAAVAGAEPLRQRSEVAFEDTPLEAVGFRRRGENSTQVDDVEREPRGSEEHEDGHQHPQQARLGAADVGGGTRLGRQVHDATAPDFYANQRVEDADADERQQVAGEENDADGKGGKHPWRRPVGVADGELVAAADDERPLTVDEQPRQEYDDRKYPDGAYNAQRSIRGHFSRRGVKNLYVSTNIECSLRR